MGGELWAGVVVMGTLALLWAERTKNGPLKAVAKTTAATAFILEALAFGAWDGTWSRTLVAALVLCWFGDVFLLSRKDRLFLGGLVAFLLGHVAYCVMFVQLGLDGLWAGVGAAVVLALFPLIARWVLPHTKAAMKGPVIAYMLVISAMVVLAAGATGATGRPIFLVAACMFFVSDLSVARDRFIAPGFDNKLWGSPLYFGAQIVFAASVAG